MFIWISVFSDICLNENLTKFDYSAPFLLNLTRHMKELKHRHQNKQLEANKTINGTAEKATISSKSVNVNVQKSISPLLKLSKLMQQGKTIDSPLKGNVLDSFTDKTKLISIEVEIDGKKKIVKAYKDGVNILLPCSGKNCKHLKDSHLTQTQGKIL